MFCHEILDADVLLMVLKHCNTYDDAITKVLNEHSDAHQVKDGTETGESEQSPPCGRTALFTRSAFSVQSKYEVERNGPSVQLLSKSKSKDLLLLALVVSVVLPCAVGVAVNHTLQVDGQKVHPVLGFIEVQRKIVDVVQASLGQQLRLIVAAACVQKVQQEEFIDAVDQNALQRQPALDGI
jgi:hypothetical protein